MDVSAELSEGQMLQVFRNPLANKINDITSKGNGLFIATGRGLFELHGTSLSKVDIGGMGNSNILSVKTNNSDEMWFASAREGYEGVNMFTAENIDNYDF